MQDHVRTTNGLTMVKAVAGAGKTSLLVNIAKELNAENGLYMAYNKAIATEASSKFPKGIKCCTTHSLAYSQTVKVFGLSIGFFTYRDISESLPYESKCELVELVREYCLSEYETFSDFVFSIDAARHYIAIGTKYLNLMQSGVISCTHDFYLKYFHLLLLHNQINYDVFDVIMLDEAGDLNPVTLAIFNLLPAKKKIMVGDPYQNIYSFNFTINCFAVMADKGTLLPMTQSFRVSASIATRIQAFCRAYLDPKMDFKGIADDPHRKIVTRAFISRTNSSLVAQMVKLNASGTPYGLTRTAKQIFQFPLVLCGLKRGGFIPQPEYKYLQEDVDAFYAEPSIRIHYTNPLSYIKSQHPGDSGLQSAIGLVLSQGKAGIIDCFNEAKKHEKGKQDYILGTGHSTKGLEFCEVEIADDLNKAAMKVSTKIIEGVPLEDLSVDQRTELNLFYVACSRAKHSLINASALDFIPKNLGDRSETLLASMATTYGG